MNLRVNFLAVLLGIFFVVSGIGKILDVSAFRDIVFAYGIPYAWSILAVPIPALEIVLGVALLLNGPSRILVFISAATLILFTFAFAYAHFAEGVEDCGCFGRLTVLESSPLVSFGRNAILIAIALYLMKITSSSNRFSMSTWKWVVMACVGAVAFLASGMSSVQPLYTPEHPFLNKKIAETPVADLVNISPDSTYLIFALSTSCGSCWDAVENVKAYKRMGVVHEIYGLSYGDEIDLLEFNDRFEPNFEIKIVERELFDSLIEQTPTAFFVQNGVIESIQTARVMSAARFYEEGLSGSDQIF